MSITTTLKRSVSFGRAVYADANSVMEYICDTAADLSDLPTSCLAGSKAYVASTGDSYVLNAVGVWLKVAAADSADLYDRCGSLPHLLSVSGSVTVEVLSIGGWELYTPKAITDGAWVYNGWKLKLSVCAGSSVSVNGTDLTLTDNVGYYTAGTGVDVNIVVTEEE